MALFNEEEKLINNFKMLPYYFAKFHFFLSEITSSDELLYAYNINERGINQLRHNKLSNLQ